MTAPPVFAHADPVVVLDRGRAAFFAGRYPQALADFAWFHEHALRLDRAYYGVRLSFALGYWKELADAYPPALEALEAVRAGAARALLGGEGDRALFHDVVAIDRMLGRPRDTHELFRTLWTARPDLARACRDLAVEPVAEAGDYALAAQCLPHPEIYVLWLAERLNADLARRGMPRRVAARRMEACASNYCRDVRTAQRILRGLGNRRAADAFREWAVALVDSRAARERVLRNLATRR